jgi:hypothetical protein
MSYLLVLAWSLMIIEHFRLDIRLLMGSRVTTGTRTSS